MLLAQSKIDDKKVEGLKNLAKDDGETIWLGRTKHKNQTILMGEGKN